MIPSVRPTNGTGIAIYGDGKMNLLDAILDAQGGGAVKQLAKNFGMGEDQAISAISHLLPALSSGLKRNVSSESGLQGLLSALSGGNHRRYLEDPSVLEREETRQDGNGILGHIFGSKDVSRRVAQNAADKTGLGVSILKKMLPLVAAMAMGSLSKRAAEPEFRNAMSGGQQSGLLGMLTPFLDADKDGSVADDLLGMFGKLLG
jgi:hypothetical protein